ncbi:MAG: Uma2 family endonuclease [Oscillatoria sp. SIO1A7]|nr:Uma2 family endonuclease [Oscillatoria sp. SIO1A7]
MVAIQDPKYMSPQEYLDWEELQPIKYEYINGEVFAMMAGGTIPHNAIAVNLTTALRNHTKGGPCRVYMADAKVGISEKGPFHYPDVMVTCDRGDKKARKVIYHPCLIAEVLSPSTERYDRGQKFQQYRRISSLREYLLISAEQMTVECFRLNEQGIWELHSYADGEELHLTSLDFRCPIELLYEDVVLEEEDQEQE